MVAHKVAMRRLVLLDAHAILHRAFHALPDFTSPKGEPTGALYGLVAMVLKIVEELKPDYVVACFDLPEPTHRHHAFDGYKAQRAKTDEALVAQIDRSRDVFAALNIPILQHPGFEADDILGTVVERLKDDHTLELIIASGDMDTLQLVEGKRVCVYTLRKGIKDTILYDEAAVVDRFGFGPRSIPDYKGLRGDPSDNIPGIRGIGEKTATTLIRHFGTIEAVYSALEKEEESVAALGMTPRVRTLLKEHGEEAEFSKMLATIRRDAPIDFSIPQVCWRDGLSLDRVLPLFAELGFRTLAERMRQLCGAAVVPESRETEHVSADDISRIGLALWVLRSDITNPTLDDILDFGRTEGKCEDFATSAAYILDQVRVTSLARIYEDIELPLMPVLRAMERRGIAVDVDYLRTLSDTFHRELSEQERVIHAAAGSPFNINSPKQLADVLYDTLGLGTRIKKTATGQRSTREDELRKLRAEHPIIDHVLRYRELQKLLSTYIDSLPAMVGPDGRVHTTFLQAGTTTGRIASQNPNLQNIPVRTEEGRAIRRAFKARDGTTLVAIDYSQIELRIAAILSRDEKLVDIFARGEDVHRGVASRVFNVPQEQVDAEMRRKAKVINFGILYGMGVNALRQNLGEQTTRAEAQEFLTAYFQTFTRLTEYLEETKAFARAHGYTETLYGRRRYFEGIRSRIPHLRAAAERMAINAPIQGTAADMLRVAMIRIHALCEKGEGVAMLLQVHDELLFEIEDGHEESIESIRTLMQDVIPQNEREGVPIIAEVSVGENWGELQRLPA